jgi:hypothetical protein
MRLHMLVLAFLMLSNSAWATVTLSAAAENAALAVDLARKGEYGRLSTAQINMLLEAKNRLEKLARENTSLAELDEDERETFDSALGRVERLTRSDNKNRVVCKKVVKTGTRLVESECLTVAQREARAKNSRERSEQLQRGLCNNTGLACSGGG